MSFGIYPQGITVSATLWPGTVRRFIGAMVGAQVELELTGDEASSPDTQHFNNRIGTADQMADGYLPSGNQEIGSNDQRLP